MPRVGFTPAEQTQGGSFRFPGGKAKVTRSIVVNHAIPGFTADCGFRVELTPLDDNWKPTGAEPVEEFLKYGPVERNGQVMFHPGKAAGSDDNNPELEIGRSLDCGGEAGAEGTCVLSASGAGPNNKAKIAIFGASLLHHGVKAELLNGYAPNLVGLEAEFTQFMMEKIPGSTAKQDPTCLIVGKGGQVAGGQIHRYPDAMTGQGTPATVAAPGPVAAPKPNGAPAPTSVQTAGTDGQPSEDVDAAAQSVLLAYASTRRGEVVTRQRINAALQVTLAKADVDPSLHKPVLDLIKKNEAWFQDTAVKTLGWKVEGSAVTLPV